MAETVLVFCATGKMGLGVARGLKDKGLNVYGTTRKSAGSGKLTAFGITPIVANYVVRADVDRAIAESKATSVVFLTDFFLAAKKSVSKEFEQGKLIVDACKAAGVQHTIFLSVFGPDKAGPKVLHFHAKLQVENYLKASGIQHSILQPVAFFENLDDATNYNPLKKGAVKCLWDIDSFWIGTYDLGKAAAVMLLNKAEWSGKTLVCTSYKGTLQDVAASLQKVSGVPTKASLAMPMCARSLFLGDLHHMCLWFENGYQGCQFSVEDFKKVVPDAMDAEAWFRYHGKYADGSKIVA
jgi:uncharacterized protein YbjT (DUF2867 family)